MLQEVKNNRGKNSKIDPCLYMYVCMYVRMHEAIYMMILSNWNGISKK